MAAECHECKCALATGESGWASDWTVIGPEGAHAETRFTCDDCNGGMK